MTVWHGTDLWKIPKMEPSSFCVAIWITTVTVLPTTH